MHIHGQQYIYGDEYVYQPAPMRNFIIAFAFFGIIFSCIFLKMTDHKAEMEFNEKYLYVREVMKAKMNFKQTPLIKYDYYGWPNDKDVNCKDWSFAFVTLWGKDAELLVTKGHAFARVGKRIIEPQNDNYKQRILTTNYDNYKVVKIREEDKEAIRRYFRE